jgi:D-alanine-D-alanine ligase
MSKNILIVQGGYSNEAEVSRKTADNVNNALISKGYKTKVMEVNNYFINWLINNKCDVDIIFNALHGPWGEDGKIQGLFEYVGIPYTHSGVTASALGMNKQLSKSIFNSHGITVPKGKIINKDLLLDEDPYKRPYIIKPVNEGSSLGIFLIKKETDIKEITKKIKLENFMAEQFIPGNDITVALIEGKPIGMIEIINQKDVYSYNEKYKSGSIKYIIPKNIEGVLEEKILKFSKKSYHSLNCEGIARVDFRLNRRSKQEKVFLLELNTQPGLTVNSLFPKIAENAGITFPDLVEWIINNASLKK